MEEEKRNRKDGGIRKNRLKALGWLVSILYVLLAVKIYFIQEKYGSKSANNSVYNNVQLENISDMNYQLLDTNGKDMLKYNKKYVVVIDSKPFKLNNYKENIEEIMAFELIMKNEIQDKFSFDEVINSEGKKYYNVSEEGYEKLSKLKNIKGIYCYSYDALDKSRPWSIENIIANISESDEGKFEKDTLPYYINSINTTNKKSSAKFYLDADIEYKQGGYSISKDNLIPYTTINKEWNDNIKSILNKEEYKNLDNSGVIILEQGKIRAFQCKDETKPNSLLASTGIGYEPGSTFKILVLQAALEEEKTYFGEKFNCLGLEGEGKCKKAHGEITLQKAVEVSCNNTFKTLGERVGYDELMKYVNKYGLGTSILGLDESIEAPGIKPVEDSKMNNISIGQTFNVTPLQMAGIYDSIINEGYYYKPYIIEKIMNYSGDVVKEINPMKERICSKENSSAIKESLRKTVLDGTGIAAQVNGIDIGGKTGSSTGNDGTTHGWFIGYFNIGKKYYTMVVFTPNINGKNEKGEELQGGNTCAPIFRDVVKEIVK